jgi:hypothetical protein
MSDFSLKRDWKNIDWKATFMYNVFRSVCATPLWVLFSSLLEKHFVWQMILFPLVYFAFWLPFGLICGWLARLGVPFIGLLSIFSSLVIVIGDPIAWTVHKIKPELVPIDKPPFIDFHLIVFVTKNPDAIQVCNYEGRIVADENVQFMGEAFPIRKTLFIIKSDWSVETLKDQYFGFVDIQGAIKRGRLQKGIDPRETNIGEMVAYIGHDNVCYSPQQLRLGQYDTMPEPQYVLSSASSNSEEDHKEMLDRHEQISQNRKLVKSDFPDDYQTCPFAGHVEAITDFTFLDTDWSQKEIIFDIDLRGYVKTPYDDFFGYIEENGDIYCDNEQTETPFKVASLKGPFCYIDNKKVGQFLVQTD